MRIRRSARVGAILTALAFVGVAVAGPPGTWSRAGKRPGAPDFQAALARTADGVLHVVSLRQSGAKVDLWQVRIDSDGRLLGSNRIARGWSQLANPALVPTGDGGVRALFGGDHVAADPNPGLMTATAPAQGAPWTIEPDPVSPGVGTALSEVGAAGTRDGTVIAAWALPSGDLSYRYGVDPATVDIAIPVSGCCASHTAVVVDASTARAFVAWFSSARGASGIYVRSVGPRGPVGRPIFAPGSASRFRARASAPGERLALVARFGGDVYLAYGAGYPVARAVALWRVGDAKPIVRLPALHATEIALASAPERRLWLAWERDGAIYVTRTNRAVTRTEPVRAITSPPRTTSIWHVQGEGSFGPLDLVTNLDATGGTTFWHEQILPLLSLRVTVAKQADGSARYAFAATDAGDPVPNATVRVGTQTLTTGLAGTVVLTTTDRPLAAFASKAGYASASATIPKP